MNKIYCQLIYLLACGVNNISPKKEYLQDVDVQGLYYISASHQLDALVGTTLKKTGISLPKEWEDAISKAVRKTILFQAERTKLLNFMESKGIWYLPLKGIVMKEYYPALGMRQMSDNDILYDGQYCEEIRNYMISQGYSGNSIGQGCHDVYQKEPVFNFELHRLLYENAHLEGWKEYYQNVKDRLVLNNGSRYGYHFKDEDFYVYIMAHAYKHYAVSTIGIRNLLDFYVFLKEKEQKMDFAYIERECAILKISAFEKQNRELCKKVFGEDSVEKIWNMQDFLQKDEIEMLDYYLTKGPYKTAEDLLENRIRKDQEKSGSHSKIRYIMNRAFSVHGICWYFPIVRKHKWLLPIGFIGRGFQVLFNKKRRRKMQQELKIVERLKSESMEEQQDSKKSS